MYNFVSAKTYGAWTSSATASATVGQVNLSYIKADGVRGAVDSNVVNGFDLMLRRLDNEGGDVYLPLSKVALTVAKLKYAAPVRFTTTVTFTAIDAGHDATLLITKKGVPFNERGTWTVNFNVLSDLTAAQVAAKFVPIINANTAAHGITASASGAVVTLTASEPGVDYKIQVTDGAYEAVVATGTAGKEGYGTVEKIKELAQKAAADAGFEYTFKDGADLLYPNFPFDPASGTVSVPNGYSVVAIRCGEPRDFKTNEEVVYQLVIVAFPETADAQAESLVSALQTVGAKIISKEASASPSNASSGN